MGTPRPVLNQLNLIVRDMETTLAFYGRLGLAIPKDARKGPHHTELCMPGGFTLEFDSRELAQAYNASARDPQAGSAVIGFGLASREEVDRLYLELTSAGHPGCQAPYDTFWGARYAIVADPDGQQVGLMSPIDPARRSAPPPLA